MYDASMYLQVWRTLWKVKYPYMKITSELFEVEVDGYHDTKDDVTYDIMKLTLEIKSSSAQKPAYLET